MFQSEFHDISVEPHLKWLLSARPSLDEGSINFVPEAQFPNIWAIYKGIHHFLVAIKGISMASKD